MRNEFYTFNSKDAIKYGVLEAVLIGDMNEFSIEPGDICWCNFKWLKSRYCFASREEITLAIRHLVAEGILTDRGV